MRYYVKWAVNVTTALTKSRDKFQEFHAERSEAQWEGGRNTIQYTK